MAPDVFIGAEGVQSHIGEPLQVEAGEGLKLRLARVECCVYTAEVPAPVSWATEPQDGVSLDRASGLLDVSPGVADGTVIPVRALAWGGLRRFEATVEVFKLDRNPLVGTWRETGQIACESGEELPAEQPIEELIFSADGSLRVTWRPFEAYVDYAGNYQLLPENRLHIAPRRVNYLPSDFDGEGIYRVDEEDKLWLEDIWLGSPQVPVASTASTESCGHVFDRR